MKRKIEGVPIATILKEREVVVSGARALEVTFKYIDVKDSKVLVNVYILKDKDVYIITLEDKDRFYSTFTQILSTFKFIEKTPKITLSYIDVSFSSSVKGTISLTSPDAKIEETKYISCLASIPGKKEYDGNFTLNFKESSLDLGRMFFAEGTGHDGTLFTKKLNPDNPEQDFIILFQYGSCNFEIAKFYRYDFVNQKLMQYKFRKKNGSIQNEIYGGLLDIPPSEDLISRLDVLPSRDFISKFYDNGIGKVRATKWRFNNKNNIFEEVYSWLEELE